MSAQYSKQQDDSGQHGQSQQQNPPPYYEKDALTAEPAATVIIRDTQLQPNDYLTLAIFATLCCCLPLGIVALIKAGEVRSKFSDGDMAGASESSKAAKKWGIWGVIAGIAMWVLAVVFLIVYIKLIVDPQKAEAEQTNDPTNDFSSSYQ
ncbi:proline-rich transmembrane protein 1-like [Apostichopus japonicus]|uniref:proline-rich transmembrane protein 1-like n=1 Tax=Stichopus japonicus TaxID=307972 RepID=UPI003AB2A0AF